MKTVIVYESTHHQNTLKLVKAIVDTYGSDGSVKAVSIENEKSINLNDYDFIGLASGIDNGYFYSAMENYSNRVLRGKKVFLIYTSGSGFHYGDTVARTLKGRGCSIIGEYTCKGFDTAGMWKSIGGVAKGHPTEEEIENAVKFYGKLIGEAK